MRRVRRGRRVGVCVRNLVTGTETYYPELRVASYALGLSETAVSTRLRKYPRSSVFYPGIQLRILGEDWETPRYWVGQVPVKVTSPDGLVSYYANIRLAAQDLDVSWGYARHRVGTGIPDHAGNIYEDHICVPDLVVYTSGNCRPYPKGALEHVSV